MTDISQVKTELTNTLSEGFKRAIFKVKSDALKLPASFFGPRIDLTYLSLHLQRDAGIDEQELTLVRLKKSPLIR